MPIKHLIKPKTVWPSSIERRLMNRKPPQPQDAQPPQPLSSTHRLGRVLCREICVSDIDAIVDLLASGFPERSGEFWRRGLARLAQRSSPVGLPRFGYFLEADGRPVGVLLLIFTTVGGDEESLRCSVSGWYVEPRFRFYAPMLTTYALRHAQVTYVNLTPDKRTWPILEAQGYKRFCTGTFWAVPLLSRSPAADCRTELVGAAPTLSRDLPPWEASLLSGHAALGCVSFICRSSGESHPFVFLPNRRLGPAKSALLVYCKDIDDVARFARPIGRALVRHGICLIEIDATGPIRHLAGRYLDGSPKFYRGPDRPRLGDIAYSERVLLGF